MENKNLERAIKNLQNVIDDRKDKEQIESAVKALEEAKAEKEKSEQQIPTSVLLSTYAGICNGPIGAVGGFVVGKIVEEVTKRNDMAAKMWNGFMKLIHDINSDSKEKT